MYFYIYTHDGYTHTYTHTGFLPLSLELFHDFIGNYADLSSLACVCLLKMQTFLIHKLDPGINKHLWTDQGHRGCRALCQDRRWQQVTRKDCEMTKDQQAPSSSSLHNVVQASRPRSEMRVERRRGGVQGELEGTGGGAPA